MNKELLQGNAASHALTLTVKRAAAMLDISTCDVYRMEERGETPRTVRSDDLLTLNQAATQLGYSTSGLRKIVNRTKEGRSGPQIQFFQIGGGRIKFRQEWLDEFVLSNSIEPGQVVFVRKPKRERKSAVTNRSEVETHWGLGA
jgi:hypothetical protein